MPSTPPRLTARSADRMADVADAAGTLIDGGMNPDQAVAKAAAAHGMPVEHVPFVVRAVNTERTVRQLASSSDPWAKAAAHPVASVEGVKALLAAPPGSGPVKVAGSLADYLTPPPAAKPVPPPRLVQKPTPVTKVAADQPYDPARWAPRGVPAEKRTADNRISSGFKAAAIVDAAVEIAKDLTPGQYAAAKLAAARLAPAGSAFVFAALTDHPATFKIAAAADTTAPDPRVRTDHPLVKAAQDLEAVRAAYREAGEGAEPADCEKIAGNLYRKLPVCPILGTPIRPEPATPPPAPTPEETKSAGFLDGMTAGAKAIGYSPIKRVSELQLTKDMVPWGKPPQDRPLPKPSSGDMRQLDQGLASLGTHAAVQDMLTDPRFAKADPKLLVESYRQFAGLAPQAMANPAIAADFVQRRLQTGPLSYYDLKALTDIEHNLARIRKADTGGDPDDD